MKTKQKKQLTLFDVRRRNQREQKRKRDSKFRKLLLRLASSRPTSPFRMAMQMAAAAAFGYMVAKAQARMITAVANHVLSGNKA